MVMRLARDFFQGLPLRQGRMGFSEGVSSLEEGKRQEGEGQGGQPGDR